MSEKTDSVVDPQAGDPLSPAELEELAEIIVQLLLRELELEGQRTGASY